MDKLSAFLQSIRPIKDGDIVDQLSYFYSVLALTISAFVIFGWSFVGTPLQCWFPPQFKGWWNEYARDYCFAQNTYFVQFTEVGKPKTYFDIVEKTVDIPRSLEEREEKLIPYYQWVPFVLALVALCFYAPVVLWRALCNQFGINVKAVCQFVTSADTVGKEGRQKRCMMVAKFIDTNLAIKDSLHETAISGWAIVILYLFIKLIYLFNVVAQFFVLQYFLNAKTNWWGVQVMGDLMNGSWFWYLFVAIITALSFLYWVMTSISKSTGRKIITGYLGLSDKELAQSPRAQTWVNQFIDESVRPNGIFLIRLVGFRAGDLVAAELTQELWKGFKRRHHLDEQNGQTNPTAPVSLASPYTAYPTLPKYEEAIIKNQEIPAEL